jgi:hypothetical protein
MCHLVEHMIEIATPSNSQRQKKRLTEREEEHSKRKGEGLAMRREEEHEMMPSSCHCDDVLY